MSQLDPTAHSEVGDTVALEYPVGHPDRIRGAGRGADGRETNEAFAWIGAIGIGVALACATTAVIIDRRRSLAVRP